MDTLVSACTCVPMLLCCQLLWAPLACPITHAHAACQQPATPPPKGMPLITSTVSHPLPPHAPSSHRFQLQQVLGSLLVMAGVILASLPTSATSMHVDPLYAALLVGSTAFPGLSAIVKEVRGRCTHPLHHPHMLTCQMCTCLMLTCHMHTRRCMHIGALQEPLTRMLACTCTHQ